MPTLSSVKCIVWLGAVFDLDALVPLMRLEVEAPWTNMLRDLIIVEATEETRTDWVNQLVLILPNPQRLKFTLFYDVHLVQWLVLLECHLVPNIRFLP